MTIPSSRFMIFASFVCLPFDHLNILRRRASTDGFTPTLFLCYNDTRAIAHFESQQQGIESSVGAVPVYSMLAS